MSIVDFDPGRCQGRARYAVQCHRRVRRGELVCFLHKRQLALAIVDVLVRELKADIDLNGDGRATALDEIGSYVDGYEAGCRDALERRRVIGRPA